MTQCHSANPEMNHRVLQKHEYKKTPPPPSPNSNLDSEAYDPDCS
jgi:hypothetical protein